MDSDMDGDDDVGILTESYITVSTGRIDYIIFAATTISIPSVATTISNDYQLITVINPSVIALEGGTLTANGPAVTLSPSKPASHDDWLPQSASYAHGALILGVKTSTNTYPPQVLTPASVLAPHTVTAAAQTQDTYPPIFPNQAQLTSAAPFPSATPASTSQTSSSLVSARPSTLSFLPSNSSTTGTGAIPPATITAHPLNGAATVGPGAGMGPLLWLLAVSVLSARAWSWAGR